LSVFGPAAVEFALTLVEQLIGADKKKEVAEAMVAANRDAP
jgi:hypothetical protein